MPTTKAQQHMLSTITVDIPELGEYSFPTKLRRRQKELRDFNPLDFSELQKLYDQHKVLRQCVNDMSFEKAHWELTEPQRKLIKAMVKGLTPDLKDITYEQLDSLFDSLKEIIKVT